MFKWASITCSFIALAAFAVVGFTAGERVREGCISDPIVLPLPPQCGMLTDITLGVLGFGVILTWSLLVLHYLVAATRRSWGWIITFFVVPPVCFLFSAFGVNPPGARADLLPSLVYLPIGLPNLLFGIFSLKARREATKKLSGS